MVGRRDYRQPFAEQAANRQFGRIYSTLAAIEYDGIEMSET
jgi:hypothetical protein